MKHRCDVIAMGTVAGVDEAGRGCAIGPLVVAGVLIDESKVDDLRLMGVRDSKKLSPMRREALVPEIEAVASRCAHFIIAPRAIDRVVERGEKLRKLNYLEAMAMARVIRDLRPDRAYVDPSDVLPDRFADQILRVLPERPEMICEHRADDKYAVVSAASILAKVKRDLIVAELRREHGDFGSGYCHDARTISFLEAWFRERDWCPPFIRGSWATVKRIRGLR
ncbi:MAG: ribonuclease HII [Candidatus Bathyarchaeota archaeon]|nr:ribonuclease HII [Candidatus Bathyarchaeota archaeon]